MSSLLEWSVSPVWEPRETCQAIIQIDADVLNLGVAPDGFKPLFSIDPTLLIAAMRRMRKLAKPVIYHDSPHLETASHVERFVDVLSPNCGVQSIYGVIGLAEEFFLILPLDHSKDWSKDFFLSD